MIISGISLIVSLYLFEGYLTFKKPFSKEKAKEQLYEKQTGKKWDTRSKLDVYKELKNNSNKVTTHYYPSLFLKKNYSNVPFPLSGMSNSETIHCNENVIIQFIKVIDMVLIIQIMNGMKKKLSIF